MLEYLFGSKTRAQLLRLLFREPERAFFVRELTRLLDVQINAVRRELELLERLSIVREMPAPKGEEHEGSQKRKFYGLDPTAFVFEELKALVIKMQLIEERELINDILHKGGSINLFLVTGRFTGDKDAPIDMLIVGNLKEKTIAKLADGYEKRLGFPLRYTTLTLKEFQERRHMMDKFLYSIFEANHLKVVDEISG